MTATFALIVDTFREAMARKIFWGLFGLSLLMVLFFLFIMKIDVVEGATATITLFGQQAGPRDGVEIDRMVKQVHSSISTFLYSFGMFLAVFASAGLIPSVLEPGRIEVMLSKPISRAHLLMGRFIGNVLVVSCNIVLLVGGVWLIFGWKTGIWSPGFLVAIPTTIFIFSVLLTVVVLAGVLWESTAVSTMIPVVIMILSPILAQEETARRLLSSEWSRQLWLFLYIALPKVFDVGRMTLDITLGQGAGSWWPIWTSGAFGILVYGTAQWIFEKRDF
ncbi:MAG: ABC transporter permease subunit [Acidobacteria bacterium]|nr:ABC transporter permease subunit [Acidobacteriota bacterium]